MYLEWKRNFESRISGGYFEKIGTYVVDLKGKLIPQVYFVKMQIGKITTLFKLPIIKKDMIKNFNKIKTVSSDAPQRLLKQKQAFVDTIVVTKSGYAEERKPIVDYSGTHVIFLEKE